MNILPKKRWHVRTKENVARVRRDEAQAAEEEKARLERAKLAEQEARTQILRKRAAQRNELNGENETLGVSSIGGPNTSFESGGNSADPQDGTAGHVNFFADLEQQERTFGANKDHEAEKRREKEAEERKIGLLKFLGEGSAEYTKETPWYQKPPERITAAQAGFKQSNDISTVKKDLYDKLSRKLYSNSNKDSKKLKHKRSQSNNESDSESEYKKSKRKRRKRRNTTSSSSDEAESESDSAKSEYEVRNKKKHTTTADINALRAERLRREREERSKTERLLAQVRGGITDVTDKAGSRNDPHHSGFRQQPKYNSQFNPDIARQNRM